MLTQNHDYGEPFEGQTQCSVVINLRGELVINYTSCWPYDEIEWGSADFRIKTDSSKRKNWK